MYDTFLLFQSARGLEADKRIRDAKCFLSSGNYFVVAVCSGAKNLEVKDGIEREVGAFKTTASGFSPVFTIESHSKFILDN